MCVYAALRAVDAEFETFDVLSDPLVRTEIKSFSNWPTIPQCYIHGEFVGGSDILLELFESGESLTHDDDDGYGCRCVCSRVISIAHGARSRDPSIGSTSTDCRHRRAGDHAGGLHQGVIGLFGRWERGGRSHGIRNNRSTADETQERKGENQGMKLKLTQNWRRRCSFVHLQ